MDEQLKAMGIEPKNWDAAGSQPTQTDQVKTAITAGSDLLIVNIVETSTSDPAKDIVDAAKAADIPVIFFNREVADLSLIHIFTAAGRPQKRYKLLVVDIEIEPVQNGLAIEIDVYKRQTEGLERPRCSWQSQQNQYHSDDASRSFESSSKLHCIPG